MKTSAVTHMPIANWASRSRRANSEMGSATTPAKSAARTIARYGVTPCLAR